MIDSCWQMRHSTCRYQAVHVSLAIGVHAALALVPVGWWCLLCLNRRPLASPPSSLPQRLCEREAQLTEHLERRREKAKDLEAAQAQQVKEMGAIA